MDTKRMCAIALMTALIAVSAWITIPMTIPFTMQIFGVAVALVLLGGRDGTIAILLYLLLGAVGVPVFSGFQGGLAVLTKATGGYIVGFLGMGLVYWVTEGRRTRSLPARALRLAVGLAVCYAFGTAWFAEFFGSGKSVTAILSLCVVPYIIPDLVKIGLALFVGIRVRRTGVLGGPGAAEHEDNT